MSNCIVVSEGKDVPYSGDITFHFDKPTGKRVKAIRLPTSAEFKKRLYGSPVNVVVEGAGHGATAFADFNFNTTNLTGVVVACGGSGYDENTKAYVYSRSTRRRSRTARRRLPSRATSLLQTVRR